MLCDKWHPPECRGLDHLDQIWHSGNKAQGLRWWESYKGPVVGQQIV